MNAQQSLRRKPIPQRSCVVCREKSNKPALNRIVMTEEGIVVDRSGKLRGRGAYLCHKPACWQRAINTDILEKALRVSFTQADRERLRQSISTPL